MTASSSSSSITSASKSNSSTSGSGTPRKRSAVPKKCYPMEVILWAFEMIPTARGKGLSSNQVIRLIMKHYKLDKDEKSPGRKIGVALRSAVEFGLIKRRGKRFFLPRK